jgi:hypothetical protein
MLIMLTAFFSSVSSNARIPAMPGGVKFTQEGLACPSPGVPGLHPHLDPCPSMLFWLGA